MADSVETTENAGGLGPEPLLLETHPHSSVADMRLIQRAIRNGWNIPKRTKEIVAARLELIVDCVETEADTDRAIRAASVLVAADKADISRERNEIADRSKASEPPALLGPAIAAVNVTVNNAVQVGTPITDWTAEEFKRLPLAERLRLIQEANAQLRQ